MLHPPCVSANSAYNIIAVFLKQRVVNTDALCFILMCIHIHEKNAITQTGVKLICCICEKPLKPLRFQGLLYGASIQIRTGDLILTKDALCRLSYRCLCLRDGDEPSAYALYNYTRIMSILKIGLRGPCRVGLQYMLDSKEKK